MNIQRILSADISFQSAIWQPIDQQCSVLDVLELIKSSQYREQVLTLRELLFEGDEEGYTMRKRNLPAVSFCGTFDKIRKKENLQSYSSLMVLDIDKLTKEKIEFVRKILCDDPYVFAFWVSPSGNGFKGLISLDYHFEFDRSSLERAHKSAFQLLKSYFQTKYKIDLDESGSDVTRLCFLSFDPDLTIKQEVNPFPVDHFVSSKHPNPETEIDEVNEKRLLQFKNKPEEKESIESIIAYLQNTGKSITKSYARWFRVAFALCEAFTFKTGLSYFLSLSEQDGPDYDEDACRNLYYYCYKNATGKLKLNTIIFYAREEGYQSQASHPLKSNKPDEKES